MDNPEEITEETSWRDDLPEELREAPYFAKANDLNDAIAAIKNAAQLQGKSILAPGPDAEIEDIAAFKDKLAEKYPSLFPDQPEQPPEPFTPDESTPAEIAQQAAELGLNTEQAAALMRQHEDQQQQLQSYRQQQRDSLRAAWDTDLDVNLSQVANFMARTGAPESLREALTAGTLDAAATAWIHRQAQLTDTEAAEFAGQGRGPVENRETAQQRVKALDDQMRSGTLDPAQYQDALAQKVRLLNGHA